MLVELDGRIGHLGEGQWRDMERDNAHVFEAAATLRYGWRQTSDRPCAVAREVAAMLTHRGWLGLPKKCRNCR